MPRLIAGPTVVKAAGNLPKRIEEYVGRVNSGDDGVSVARMVSPQGWIEPGQRPEFEEITIVLRGLLRVEYEAGSLAVRAGQAFHGGDAFAVRLHREHQTGAYRLALDQHRAGAADPMLAAHMGAGDVQTIAQEIEQCGARLGLGEAFTAVDGHGYGSGYHGRASATASEMARAARTRATRIR